MSLRSSDPSTTSYDYHKLDHQTSIFSSSFKVNDSLMSNFLAHASQLIDQNESGKVVGKEHTENSACPSFDKDVNYYHEFWRMYLQNEALISQMVDHAAKTREIQAKIAQIEPHLQELDQNRANNRKRDEANKKKRRKATEIEKNFACPYEGCHRPYGSDVSLNLHIKLKHSGGNKTEREKLAKMIIEAKLKHKDLPEINLNLPPGFLEGLNIQKLLTDMSITNSKEMWEDNANITHLLTELDKAIEKDRIKTHSDGTPKGEGHDHSDHKTDRDTPEHQTHEEKNESPKS